MTAKGDKTHPKNEGITRAGPPKCSRCNSIMEGWTRKWVDDNSLLWVCPNFCNVQVLSNSNHKSERFPCLNQFIREDYPITTDAIDDWFKHCIKDFPGCPYMMTDGRYIDLIDEWLEKWFSQFKENK